MEKLNVKAGDKVIYTSHFGGDKVAVVEKITPKGFIKVNGTLFTEDGIERGSSVWNRSFIRKANPEDIYKIEHDNYRKRILNNLHSLQDITYEQAIEINKILNGGN